MEPAGSGETLRAALRYLAPYIDPTKKWPKQDIHAGDATRSVSLDVISFGFFDDFGTFSSGDLAGQVNWQESGITNVLWTFESDNINAFNSNVAAVEWVVTVYLLVLSGLLLIYWIK